MPEFLYKDLLKRLDTIEKAVPNIYEQRTLIHAYIACMKFHELCFALEQVISSEHSKLRIALKNRLVRLVKEGMTQTQQKTINNMLRSIYNMSEKSKRHRPAVDAILSAVFRYVSTEMQEEIAKWWIARGNRSAMARWLKATNETPIHFNAEVAFNYWRQTYDRRVAISMVKHLELKSLGSFISELVDNCEEGWIIAKAIRKHGQMEEVTWEKLKKKFPATYLYLNAHFNKKVSSDLALEMICRCNSLSSEEGRGLAIWSAGQLGLVEVLDQFTCLAKDLFDQEAEKFLDPIVDPMNSMRS